MMINRRILFAGISGLVLTGCSDVVGPPPAPRLFVLKPKAPAAQPGAPVAWALAIAAPNADAGLGMDRIAIIRPPASMDYYANAAWADPLPNLVQSGLLEAFESSGRIAAVSRDTDSARSDYMLMTDLRDFEARYDQGEGAPLAVVRLGVRLVETRSRKVEGYTSIAKEVRASANSIEAAVEALNSAFSAVLADLVPWVLGHTPPR